MPSGGHAPDHYKELTPEGNVRDPQTGEVVLGSHQGEYEHLNVTNAQAGYRYAHLRRHEGRLRNKARKGYRVVQTGDPEYQEDVFPEAIGAALGSSVVSNDVVLCRVSVEDYEKELEAKRQKALQQAGADQKFLDKRHPAEFQYETAGRPLRYSKSGHGRRYEQLPQED